MNTAWSLEFATDLTSQLTNPLMRREEKNQLDVTVRFIAFMIRSTCFGHFYAHHHQL